MWKDLSVQWQIVLEETWEAFKNGCLPVGAAIFDDNGELILREHNRSEEKETVNSTIAHAEANAIRRLDSHADYDVRKIVLYTSMEPCPMCMGTAVMGNIKHLRYGARDSYCGAVHMMDTESYMKGKKLDYTYVGGEIESYQIIIQSYCELGQADSGSSVGVLNKFRESNPHEVEVAEKFFAEKTFDRFAKAGSKCEEVYDYVLSNV